MAVLVWLSGVLAGCFTPLAILNWSGQGTVWWIYAGVGWVCSLVYLAVAVAIERDWSREDRKRSS